MKNVQRQTHCEQRERIRHLIKKCCLTVTQYNKLNNWHNNGEIGQGTSGWGKKY